jgi:hypothetical protein
LVLLRPSDHAVDRDLIAVVVDNRSCVATEHLVDLGADQQQVGLGGSASEPLRVEQGRSFDDLVFMLRHRVAPVEITATVVINS